MATRRTAYVAINVPLPEGGVVTADLYLLWPDGTTRNEVDTALDRAVHQLREQVRHRAPETRPRGVVAHAT